VLLKKSNAQLVEQRKPQTTLERLFLDATKGATDLSS